MSSRKIRQLTQQLYPRGRAFKVSLNTYFDRLHKALAVSEFQAYNAAKLEMNSFLPDNSSFSEEDATAWELRLGIYSASGTSLANRKLAIIRKMNHPGVIRTRQTAKYLEYQLNQAGFAVKVYENKFWNGSIYITKTPEQVLGSLTAGSSYHGTSIRHATNKRHGATFNNKIVNHIDEDRDRTFVIAPNYRSTFFIAGTSSITTFVDIDVERKNEFRQLILQSKPLHMCGFLFVNYV